MARFSRRAFVQLFGMGVGTAVLSTGISACSRNGQGTFEHGVASGDPLTDRVILWTRVTPQEGEDSEIVVGWQVATDIDFNDIVVEGEDTTSADRDYTVKVDAAGLSAGTSFYYRFLLRKTESPVGRTKTLPEGDVDQVKFVVFSCSNYPAGYFHAYAEAAQRVDDVDAALHLGDYIYEYDREGFASGDAGTLGRQVEPANEIVTLQDYRTRYAQYRTDADLQTLHAAVPFIAVWDDHEVANDTYKAGAENHQEDEGDFGVRMMQALQAYAEWMPIRPAVDQDVSTLARSFRFGSLVNLIMLDTRLVARDVQLNFGDFIDKDNAVIGDAFAAALSDPSRTLLGDQQRVWLIDQLNSDDATWQVFGQQVLMGEMTLPPAVLPRDLSDPSSAPLTFDQFVLLGQLGLIFQAIQAGEDVSDADRQLLEENGDFLIRNQAFLFEDPVPYNLDAWDGYQADRTAILQTAAANNHNLVVLAGDTHNAWANNLMLADGSAVGVEFATPGVSSPGLEDFLGLSAADDPTAAAESFEATLPFVVANLRYSNLLDRGFLTVTFTAANVTADWTFVSSVKESTYTLLDNRAHSIVVPTGENTIA